MFRLANTRGGRPERGDKASKGATEANTQMGHAVREGQYVPSGSHAVAELEPDEGLQQSRRDGEMLGKRGEQRVVTVVPCNAVLVVVGRVKKGETRRARPYWECRDSNVA